MDFKIVWTDRAIEELRELCSYIAERNSAAAEKVGNDISRHVDILGPSPLIGQPYPPGATGRIRELVEQELSLGALRGAIKRREDLSGNFSAEQIAGVVAGPAAVFVFSGKNTEGHRPGWCVKNARRRA